MTAVSRSVRAGIGALANRTLKPHSPRRISSGFCPKIRKLASQPEAEAIKAVAKTANHIRQQIEVRTAHRKSASAADSRSPVASKLPIAPATSPSTRNSIENIFAHRRARRAQSLEDHDLAHSAEPRARDARSEDDRAGENRERGDEPDHQRDLIHDLLDAIQNVGDIDHRHCRETLIRGALQGGDLRSCCTRAAP